MALSRNVAQTVKAMRGQKAAPVPRKGSPSWQKLLGVQTPRPPSHGKADLTPGPRTSEQGVYRVSPSTGKRVPDRGDRIDPARMPNPKYQGRQWGWANRWAPAA